jgi:D-serine deaminase-like pyridoxal phosphate-dependent protein
VTRGHAAGGTEAVGTGARTLDGLLTPAAIVDLDRMDVNLRGMAAYAAEHALRLRPHTKTHKSPESLRSRYGTAPPASPWRSSTRPQ